MYLWLPSCTTGNPCWSGAVFNRNYAWIALLWKTIKMQRTQDLIFLTYVVACLPTRTGNYCLNILRLHKHHFWHQLVGRRHQQVFGTSAVWRLCWNSLENELQHCIFWWNVRRISTSRIGCSLKSLLGRFGKLTASREIKITTKGARPVPRGRKSGGQLGDKPISCDPILLDESSSKLIQKHLDGFLESTACLTSRRLI